MKASFIFTAHFGGFSQRVTAASLPLLLSDIGLIFITDERGGIVYINEKTTEF